MIPAADRVGGLQKSEREERVEQCFQPESQSKCTDGGYRQGVNEEVGQDVHDRG